MIFVPHRGFLFIPIPNIIYVKKIIVKTDMFFPIPTVVKEIHHTI